MHNITLSDGWILPILLCLTNGRAVREQFQKHGHGDDRSEQPSIKHYMKSQSNKALLTNLRSRHYVYIKFNV